MRNVSSFKIIKDLKNKKESIIRGAEKGLEARRRKPPTVTKLKFLESKDEPKQKA